MLYSIVVVILKESCNCKWIKSKKPTKVCKQSHPQSAQQQQQQQQPLQQQYEQPQPLLPTHQRAEEKLSLKCTSTRIAKKVRPLWCSHRRPSLGSVFSVNNKATYPLTHPNTHTHPSTNSPSADTHLLISHCFFQPFDVYTEKKRKKLAKSLNDFCCFSKCFLMVYVCSLWGSLFDVPYAQF